MGDRQFLLSTYDWYQYLEDFVFTKHGLSLENWIDTSELNDNMKLLHKILCEISYGKVGDKSRKFGKWFSKTFDLHDFCKFCTFIKCSEVVLYDDYSSSLLLRSKNIIFKEVFDFCKRAKTTTSFYSVIDISMKRVTFAYFLKKTSHNATSRVFLLHLFQLCIVILYALFKYFKINKSVVYFRLKSETMPPFLFKALLSTTFAYIKLVKNISHYDEILAKNIKRKNPAIASFPEPLLIALALEHVQCATYKTHNRMNWKIKIDMTTPKRNYAESILYKCLVFSIIASSMTIDEPNALNSSTLYSRGISLEYYYFEQLVECYFFMLRYRQNNNFCIEENISYYTQMLACQYGMQISNVVVDFYLSHKSKNIQNGRSYPYKDLFHFLCLSNIYSTHVFVQRNLYLWFNVKATIEGPHISRSSVCKSAIVLGSKEDPNALKIYLPNMSYIDTVHIIWELDTWLFYLLSSNKAIGHSVIPPYSLDAYDGRDSVYADEKLLYQQRYIVEKNISEYITAQDLDLESILILKLQDTSEIRPPEKDGANVLDSGQEEDTIDNFDEITYYKLVTCLRTEEKVYKFERTNRCDVNFQNIESFYETVDNETRLKDFVSQYFIQNSFIENYNTRITTVDGMGSIITAKGNNINLLFHISSYRMVDRYSRGSFRNLASSTPLFYKLLSKPPDTNDSYLLYYLCIGIIVENLCLSGKTLDNCFKHMFPINHKYSRSHYSNFDRLITLLYKTNEEVKNDFNNYLQAVIEFIKKESHRISCGCSVITNNIRPFLLPTVSKYMDIYIVKRLMDDLNLLVQKNYITNEVSSKTAQLCYLSLMECVKKSENDTKLQIFKQVDLTCYKATYYLYQTLLDPNIPLKDEFKRHVLKNITCYKKVSPIYIENKGTWIFSNPADLKLFTVKLNTCSNDVEYTGVDNNYVFDENYFKNIPILAAFLFRLEFLKCVKYNRKTGLLQVPEHYNSDAMSYFQPDFKKCDQWCFDLLISCGFSNNGEMFFPWTSTLLKHNRLLYTNMAFSDTIYKKYSEFKKFVT